jgi:hypothetical protein
MNKNILNLQKEKKRRKNIEENVKRLINKVKSGRTKTQKFLEDSTQKKLDKSFSGHKIEKIDRYKILDNED